MILSDRSIREAVARGRLVIDPFDPALVQPSSVDLRLAPSFLTFHATRRPYLDVREPADDIMERVTVGDDEPIIVQSKAFLLGSTLERVHIPNDLVGRLEGRSSLGRLGIVIHSSLPYDEPVLFRRHGQTRPRRIGDIVRDRLDGEVVSFDPATFRVGYHRVTNWFEEPPDRVYQVVLASGRRVHVTMGHNLFTLDPSGNLVKVATRDLRRGVRVAIPGRIPAAGAQTATYRLLDLLPPDVHPDLRCSGPTVDRAFAERAAEVARALRAARRSLRFSRRVRCLPIPVLCALYGSLPPLGPEDRLHWRGARWGIPAVLNIDREIAWLLGLAVAVGSRRHRQVVIANPDERILDRAERVFESLGQRVSRAQGSLTCTSVLVSALFDALGIGGHARQKTAPHGIFDWPVALVEAFCEGLLNGDDSRDLRRESLRTASASLVNDLLLLAPLMGKQGTASGRDLFQVVLPRREQVRLTALPVPALLFGDLRRSVGRRPVEAAVAAGYRCAQGVANLESESNGATWAGTVLRVLPAYQGSEPAGPSLSARLARLADSDLLWDEVVEVVDTGRVEPVYDLEVRPDGRPIENFLAGSGGVFVSNTAGFIDPGFSGHITLEISNLANLPIALYPGMRIAQLSFIQMTTPAERAYGERALGSKYQGQAEPTPSRLYLDFIRRE